MRWTYVGRQDNSSVWTRSNIPHTMTWTLRQILESTRGVTFVCRNNLSDCLLGLGVRMIDRVPGNTLRMHQDPVTKYQLLQTMSRNRDGNLQHRWVDEQELRHEQSNLNRAGQ